MAPLSEVSGQLRPDHRYRAPKRRQAADQTTWASREDAVKALALRTLISPALALALPQHRLPMVRTAA